jgi:hypothetical protein
MHAIEQVVPLGKDMLVFTGWYAVKNEGEIPKFNFPQGVGVVSDVIVGSYARSDIDDISLQNNLPKESCKAFIGYIKIKSSGMLINKLIVSLPSGPELVEFKLTPIKSATDYLNFLAWIGPMNVNEFKNLSKGILKEVFNQFMLMLSTANGAQIKFTKLNASKNHIHKGCALLNYQNDFDVFSAQLLTIPDSLIVYIGQVDVSNHELIALLKSHCRSYGLAAYVTSRDVVNIDVTSTAGCKVLISNSNLVHADVFSELISSNSNFYVESRRLSNEVVFDNADDSDSNEFKFKPIGVVKLNESSYADFRKSVPFLKFTKNLFVNFSHLKALNGISKPIQLVGLVYDIDPNSGFPNMTDFSDTDTRLNYLENSNLTS